MEIHNSDDTDDVLKKLSKEEIWNKYQDEVSRIMKENEALRNQEKLSEQKYIDQQHLYEQSERQELLKKNKELQDAESIISQQQDEVDALQKKLLSNKLALDAMKKSLDNEKAFRICADQEIINLKGQITNNANKFKDLEKENEKLIKDKLKLEDSKTKISQQCNELLQKNISLENHCEKKDLAFDEQTNIVQQLENKISELQEKINNYSETEEENEKLLKQIKLFSKQMETYENEREVYVQRLQKIQKEENELKCNIKDLKKEVDVKNKKIEVLKENNSDLNSKNTLLIANINNLKTNFINCLKFLDDIFEKYVEFQGNQNTRVEDDLPLKLEPFLNETFELFDQTLTEYKKLKSSFKNSEMTLKDEINQKENIIKSLKDKLENYKQDKIQTKDSNTNNLAPKNLSQEFNTIYFINESKVIELEQNLKYINQIKVELLPKQKLLVSECQEFVLAKIKEIDSLNISKNNYIKKVLLKIDNLKEEIDNKNIVVTKLKNEVFKLEESLTEKNALCNEKETELQNFKDNFDSSSVTSISKADEIYRLRELDEDQEERSQKLKAIAIKQKKQIADLKHSLENEIKKHNLEKNELVNKLTSLAEQGKLARCLQQQYDIKCDEYDIKCKEAKEVVNKLKEEVNKVLEQTQLSNSLKSDIQVLKSDLVSAQKTIISLKETEKSLNSKIEVLKQEKSAGDILKADREAHVKELSNNLKTAKDKIKLMEFELNKLKTDKQKINIRDLEINSYEKTLDELSQKVKEEKIHNENLEQELSNANSVIDSLHEQIKHLEHIVTTEQERNKQNLHQVESYRTGLNNAESLLNEKENCLIECQERLGQEKELNMNLTKKYDVLLMQYETDKENYQSQHIKLNEKVRRLQVELQTANDSISKYMEENQSLLDDFEAYKVRAHSVFQKHKQDSVYNAKVAELSEQIQEVTKALNVSKTNLQNVLSELSTKNTEVNMLQNEINKYEKKLSNLTKTLSTKDKEIYRLSVEIDSIKSQLEKEKDSLNEKILNDKLAHEKEIERLQKEIALAKEVNIIASEQNAELSAVTENRLKESNMSSNLHDDDEMFSDFASSNESVRKISKSALMPLEDLLSFENNSVSDPVRELNISQKQLKQLTLMLNEVEKNCSRYEQQNKFLKEDIRRLERSVDRHAEIQNMEYLKNIIIKFVTLSSGVEKCHLVPVMNKLLKLSPDEQKQIETIAKGSLADQNATWSSLFTWSQGT